MCSPFPVFPLDGKDFPPLSPVQTALEVVQSGASAHCRRRQQTWLQVCVFLLIEVILGQVVQRDDPAVPQLPIQVGHLFLLHI